MGDPAFKDDDASVYKNHVLYFLPNDGNCTRLIAALEQHAIGDDVFMQDVRQLRQRPPWLDGVPILVRRKDGKAFKGHAVYNYLRTWEPDEDDFQPASASTGGYASFEDGESVFAGERKFASLFGDNMFDCGDDGEGGGASAGNRPGASRAGTTSFGGGHGGHTGQPMNEKMRRKQEAEQESSMRAQQLLDSRQAQDQRLQQRQTGGQAPTSRTTFTQDGFSQAPAGPPASAGPAMYAQRPAHVSPYPGPPPHSQYQVGGAAYGQQPLQHGQYQGAPHVPGYGAPHAGNYGGPHGQPSGYGPYGGGGGPPAAAYYSHPGQQQPQYSQPGQPGPAYAHAAASPHAQHYGYAAPASAHGGYYQ